MNNIEEYLWGIDKHEYRVEVRKSIGRQLAEARKKLGLSVWDVAHLADLSPNTVSRIESGAYTAGTDILDKLAKALNFNLILGKDNPICL